MPAQRGLTFMCTLVQQSRLPAHRTRRKWRGEREIALSPRPSAVSCVRGAFLRFRRCRTWIGRAGGVHRENALLAIVVDSCPDISSCLSTQKECREGQGTSRMD